MKLEDLPPSLRLQAIQQMTRNTRTPVFAPYGSSEESPSTRRKNRSDASSGGKSRQCEASVASSEFRRSENGEVGVFITLDVNPRHLPTAQQKGVDFKNRLFFTKPKVKAWETKLASLFSQCVHALGKSDGFLPTDFCKNGVKVEMTFNFPYNVSTPKKDRVHSRPMLKRPDCDNLAKGVLDSMSVGGLITDDNCVYSLKLSKFFTDEKPSVVICVKS